MPSPGCVSRTVYLPYSLRYAPYPGSGVPLSSSPRRSRNLNHSPGWEKYVGIKDFQYVPTITSLVFDDRDERMFSDRGAPVCDSACDIHPNCRSRFTKCGERTIAEFTQRWSQLTLFRNFYFGFHEVSILFALICFVFYVLSPSRFISVDIFFISYTFLCSSQSLFFFYIFSIKVPFNLTTLDVFSNQSHIYNTRSNQIYRPDRILSNPKIFRQSTHQL